MIRAVALALALATLTVTACLSYTAGLVESVTHGHTSAEPQAISR